MRIAVIGAGAMGGTIAALLDRAGHEVEVTARGAGLAAIREHGLRLEGGWGSHTARLEASETLTRRPELAVLATKAMDAAAAARANSAHLAGVPLVVVQNGLGGLDAVAAELPSTPLIGALALYAASYTGPGCVTVTAAAGTFLGMVGTGGGPAPDSAPARLAAEILNEAIPPVTVVDNFDGARWTKLVINQVNALPAITGLSVQDVISHRGLRRLMVRGMRETVRAGWARGIRFAEVGGLTPSMLGMLARGPLTLGEIVPLRLRAYLGAVPNPGSTLQSIRRGQPSEIDYLNGAVVAEAAGTGVPTPVNALLTRLVHEVEAEAGFLTPERVLRLAANDPAD